MPFEPGRRKTGGRKKGVKNKKTLLKVESYLGQKGISPVGEIIKLLPSLPAAQQIQVWWDIMKYVETPKRENADPLEDFDSDDEDSSIDEDELLRKLQGG